MKVRISYTVEATDFLRYAIHHHYSTKSEKARKATRSEVRQWFEMNGESCNDDITYEYQLSLENDKGAPAKAKP